MSQKWPDERVAKLQSLAGNEVPVSAKTVNFMAETLEASTRSIASKLRKLGYEVASLAQGSKPPTFTEDESQQLAQFVKSNSGYLTYAHIAEGFANGKFTSKQIQGKLLALELTSHVKPAEKVEPVRTYTEDQEAQFVQLANGGAFIEDIAKALGKTINSARGKALSLLRNGLIQKIPAQAVSLAKTKEDALEALGDALSEMTVAQIAEATGKTERGIRTALTRRGITVADHNGAAKRAKAAAK